MRTVLRLLGTRYGISVILVVAVVAIVAVARTFVDGGTAQNDALGPTVGPASQTAPASSEAILDDDGVHDDDVAPSPSLSAGAADVVTVATRFATAWLRRPGVTAEQWRRGLTPNATPELMAKLQDTDPDDVPATKITGPVVVETVGEGARARVPADGGTIALELDAVKGRWLVRTLGWEAA